MDFKEARIKAKEIVAQMTAEEKMSQLLYNAPAIERLGISSYNWWNEACHGVARSGVATVRRLARRAERSITKALFTATEIFTRD